jgi:hypothetical protein
LIINNTDYKLCLLDTNVLSELLKNPKEWLSFLSDTFSLANTILCYSAFSLSELFSRKDLFEKYIEIFSTFPSAILDGHHSIFEKEINNYFKNNEINPIVIAPFAIHEPGLNARQKLTKVIEDSGFTERTEYWIGSRQEILNGILDLKKNFPRTKALYSVAEIENFNFLASTQQISLRDNKFANSLLIDGKKIDLDRFLSIKSTSYVVFYKFYPTNRKPVLSDVFDIIISSLFPYVDFVLTEGNLCEIIKTIQNRHNFLKHLVGYSLKDINKQMVPNVIRHGLLRCLP